MRRDNSIDFWRGVALVSIFINHISGLWFERLTHRNFGFSDSAELFVFLAGWSLRMSVAGSDAQGDSIVRLMLRLAGRAVTLYAAQILITMIALAMIAGAALYLDNPLILDWHNAGAVFHDPAPTHVGLVLLTHQLGYFDILPLYVVLFAAAPMIAALGRASPGLLFFLSLAVYLLALTFRINAPTWPIAGEWFFNPFAWQFCFVLGFIMARETAEGRSLARALPVLRWPAIAFLLASLWLWRHEITPDPMSVPEPTYFFIIDKSYLTPLRTLHLLALCTAFVAAYSGIARYIPSLTAFGSALGRNSLQVFCVGSLLSLAAQLVRIAFPPSFLLDSAILLTGLTVMWGTAWLSEARVRLQRSRSSG
ncbi:MAG: hypothetical protein BGP06_09040 [Rhizobiales bacterium 65-9]|nr:OpgC domain-containing protein [Hyphomicrobiales bacterium]OJY38716.1 MAG: hypothetical protein BGP06_09040 [Rhizobiales bacterium 65-9]